MIYLTKDSVDDVKNIIESNTEIDSYIVEEFKEPAAEEEKAEEKLKQKKRKQKKNLLKKRSRPQRNLQPKRRHLRTRLKIKQFVSI